MPAVEMYQSCGEPCFAGAAGQKLSDCRKFLGAVGISPFGPNELRLI